ncbi:hypothetical protein [Burkholderia sp. D-99]|uniref:hypothetical protein n=1 Tax=Burkholderia sp. D-99 TaxID=2717316 RepID=UPI00141DB060|nr:hypothetical protein [Burkholderia sp. D-99]NHV27689.1 hypothetical protein [Burkholderia sp. D-99]
MSTVILHKYKKTGVTGVAGVTISGSQDSKGFPRNTVRCDMSHRHTEHHIFDALPVTPEKHREAGVTNWCDAKTLASIGFAATVTPVTHVTPQKNNIRKHRGGAR